ncbi:MAG: hypothetical protein KDA93_23565 [Planctomycetaceae bacterium]|nr:hypothetical protein [Planctomycetaceae bacterium]
MSETEATILSRLVDPETPTLSEEAARSILAMRFSADDEATMHVLLDKANAGTITPDEQEVADTYERIGHMLALMQSKARLSLKDSPSAA